MGASATTSRIRLATVAPTCQASLPAMMVSARCCTVPAEPDPGHDHPVDPEVDRDDERSVGRDPYADRRPAGTPGGADRLGVGHRTERLQLGDEAGDRAAVEPHPPGQLGARAGPRLVHVAQQGAEVVAADGLLVGAQSGSGGQELMVG